MEEVMDWRHKANCRDKDTELFFGIGETDRSETAEKQTRHAKNICRNCPVQEKCLSWALETGQKHGVFGGLTFTERQALRRLFLPQKVGKQGTRREPLSKRSPAYGLSEQEREELDG